MFNREEFIAPIPEAERQDMVLAYHAQLNAVDDETRIRAAKAWTKWELVSFSFSIFRIIAAVGWYIRRRKSTSKLYVDPEHVAAADKADYAK